jgi:Protein of unknown function (DUF2612)
MKNWRQTVISQYNNSPTLIKLLSLINDWISPDANMEAFYTLVLNVETAVGYGLDVWGRIVGVIRVLAVTDNFYFGFAQQDNESLVGTFGQAPFYSGEVVTSNFTLTDDAFRQLIFAKAAANITDGSIPSINALLMNLFPGRGNIYVADGLDMTETITSEFDLEPFEVSILVNSGVLPRSTGVQMLFSYPT